MFNTVKPGDVVHTCNFLKENFSSNFIDVWKALQVAEFICYE